MALYAGLCAAVMAGTAHVAGAQAKPSPSMAPQANQTATQFYMDYRTAFDKAKKIEDILPYMAAANRKQAEAQSKSDRDQMFGMIKMMSTQTKVKVTKEEKQSDGSVVLTVSGYDTDAKKDVTGKVTIVKESGAWKLGKEEWQG